MCGGRECEEVGSVYGGRGRKRGVCSRVQSEVERVCGGRECVWREGGSVCGRREGVCVEGGREEYGHVLESSMLLLLCVCV